MIPSYGGSKTPQKPYLRSEKSTPTNSNTPLKSSTLVGIRRKRLKGDAWKYKNVCEEVLALAATDLATPLEQ